MLCQLQNVKKRSLEAGFLAILFVNMTAIVWAPMAQAQVLSSEHADGMISGTVLLKSNNQPVSQVLTANESGSYSNLKFEAFLPARTRSRSMNRATSRRKQARGSMAPARSWCFI